MKLQLEMELRSPLHLSNGKGDMVVDAELVHDEYGMPYFPAKRLRGLLYESALEVAEMCEQSGLKLTTKEAVDKLFGQKKAESELYVHDLTLPNYENLRRQWNYLQKNFKGVLNNTDVLKAYTTLRYQTKIDAQNGTAAKGSLHNLRLLDTKDPNGKNIKFTGELELVNGGDAEVKLLVLAAANLRYAGAKRNRGFGEVACKFIGLDNKFSLEKVVG